MLKIIATKGYPAATTNHIAAEANVNIATLYHYFPNQYSIAQAIFEDAMYDLGRTVNELLLDSVGKSLGESMPVFLDCLIDFLKREELVLLRLSEQVPELPNNTRGISLQNLIRRSSQFYLAQTCPHLHEDEIVRRLYYVQQITLSMSKRFVLDPPPGITRAQFISDLSRMVTPFLEAPNEPVLSATKPKRSIKNG